jgi:hypothetical protein
MRRWRREAHLDRVCGALPQPSRRLHDQLAGPDDRHPIGDTFDLGRHMRRQHDRRFRVGMFSDDGVELVLDKRIQSARRLIDQEQIGGAVGEREEPLRITDRCHRFLRCAAVFLRQHRRLRRCPCAALHLHEDW